MEAANRENGVAEAAVVLDDLASRVESLLSELTSALTDWRDETDHSLARCEAARALCLAAGRVHHAAGTAAILAADAAEQARLSRHDAERTTRMWLARHTGISRREAGSWCRGALTLERFPGAHEALITGDIAPGHLDALGSIVPARLRGNELDEAVSLLGELMPDLLETARSTTVDDFELFCNHVRARLDADGPPDRSGEPSRVYLSRLFDGRWALSGDLSADDGAILKTILDDVMVRLRAADRAHGGDGQPTNSAPDNAGEQPSGDDVTGDSPRSVPERRVPSEWMADALRRLVLDGSGAKRPGRVGMFVHIDLDDLRGETPEPAHTESNLDITDDTLWGLLAGGDVTPVYTNRGSALSFGRTRRLAPEVLRRVLAHRDRCCRFPGCDAVPIWTQAHHLQFWDDGGLTDPKNLVGQCSFHHHLVHDQGWRLSGAPPDLTVHRPDGAVHVSTQQWRHRQHERERSERLRLVARLESEKRRLRAVA